jgi:hypothetical protein
MAGCFFRATGDGFDVDAFLIGSPLEPDARYPANFIKRSRNSGLGPMSIGLK